MRTTGCSKVHAPEPQARRLDTSQACSYGMSMWYLDTNIEHHGRETEWSENREERMPGKNPNA